MPDFSKNMGGWGAGRPACNKEVYLVVMEEYAIGNVGFLTWCYLDCSDDLYCMLCQGSMGNCIALYTTPLMYNATNVTPASW
jgi:hypothetical protein